MTRSELQTSSDRGPLQGFGPLFQKELKSWWGGRRWIVQALLWQVVINGLLVAVLFILPQVLPDGVADSNPLQGFFSIGSLALAIGVIVMAQDAFTTELNSGTAEWVLTKPVTRTSFVLAKLGTYTLGMLVVLIFLPGVVALVLLALAGPVDIVAFVTGLGVLALHTFFYLALTLMMGILTRSRGLILAVPLGLLLGGQLIMSLVAALPIGSLLLLTPWPLASVATALASNSGPARDLLLPIVSTAIWSIAFVFVALWRFGRLEL